jgi:hypothetical protein
MSFVTNIEASREFLSHFTTGDMVNVEQNIIYVHEKNTGNSCCLYVIGRVS